MSSWLPKELTKQGVRYLYSVMFKLWCISTCWSLKTTSSTLSNSPKKHIRTPAKNDVPALDLSTLFVSKRLSSVKKSLLLSKVSNSLSGQSYEDTHRRNKASYRGHSCTAWCDAITILSAYIWLVFQTCIFFMIHYFFFIAESSENSGSSHHQVIDQVMSKKTSFGNVSSLYLS